MKTPKVKTRAEAWVAWEASLIGRFKGKVVHPKSAFWKRWDRTFLNMFEVVSFKQYTGDITYLVKGRPRTRNLMEGKDSDWNRNAFIYADVKAEFPEFREAVTWLDLKQGQHLTFNNAMLLVDWPELYNAHQIRSWGGYSDVAMRRNKERIANPPTHWINTVWTPDGIKDIVMERNEHCVLWVLGDIRAVNLQGLVTGLLETGVFKK